MRNFLEKLLNKRSKFRISGQLMARLKRKGWPEYIELFSEPVKNTVVNTGKAQVVALLSGLASSGAFSYAAVGSDGTSPSSGQTSLGNELSRVLATRTQRTVNSTNDTVRYVATFVATGNWAVREFGIFNASSGGTMLSRVVFDTINLLTDDSLEVTYDLTIL